MSSLIKETEKVIAELPAEKASQLKYWLEEFKAARRYKKEKERLDTDQSNTKTANENE